MGPTRPSFGDKCIILFSPKFVAIHLTYAVLFGLFFMFSKFYELDLHNTTCALANLCWSTEQRLDWKTNLFRISCTYQKFMFVDFLNEYTCPLNSVSLMRVEYLNHIWRHSPISFQPCAFTMLALQSSVNTYQSNIGVQ